jgi:hypothetical protein
MPRIIAHAPSEVIRVVAGGDEQDCGGVDADTEHVQ